MTQSSRFLKACRREPVSATPIWLMRQAGALHGRIPYPASILWHPRHHQNPRIGDGSHPATHQRLRSRCRHHFRGYTAPLEGMGLSLEFIKGEGPVIHNPVRTPQDVEKLATPDPREALPFTLEAIRITRQELDSRGIPLIGFSGAPFTLASYAVEGGSSRNKIHLKSMMFGDHEAWHTLMSKLATIAGEYLLAQAEAGAQALQLFDSWVGELSPSDYRQYVQPYSKQALDIAKKAGVPLIHFGTNTNGMLEDIRNAGGDVIGVDWRIDIDVAAKRLGDEVAIQGNLDPVALYAPWDELKIRAQNILDRMKGRAGHIFNLGHGILPTTPVDNVKRLVDFVHEYTS